MSDDELKDDELDPKEDEILKSSILDDDDMVDDILPPIKKPIRELGESDDDVDSLEDLAEAEDEDDLYDNEDESW